MNLKQLEYFVSVAETLNFTKAAKKCFISQTAMTQQIRALEEGIGAALFIRDKHHVEPVSYTHLDVYKRQALASVDQELYEAAVIDGANRWKQTLHVTLPGISSTIIILLILRCGQLLNVGYEKIILLYGPSTYETADVINSFVYRKGLQEFKDVYKRQLCAPRKPISFSTCTMITVFSSPSVSRRWDMRRANAQASASMAAVQRGDTVSEGLSGL